MGIMSSNSKIKNQKSKIFILHGWTYSSAGNDSLDKWNPFIKLLTSKSIDPVLLRIPGLTKNINQVWDLEKYIEWVQKIVDKEKGKVSLLGHSNGGRIAFSSAQKYPVKMDKLILIDSAGIYHNELSIRLKRFIFKNLAKIGKKFTNSEKMKKFIYKLAREGDYKNATAVQRQTMLNLIHTDLTPILEKIKTPTLIIWGSNDKVTPLSDGQLIHRLIKNSKLSVIEDARHSPQFTHVKEVVKEIHGYI